MLDHTLSRWLAFALLLVLLWCVVPTTQPPGVLADRAPAPGAAAQVEAPRPQPRPPAGLADAAQIPPPSAPFEAMGKVASWPVVAGQPRLVDVLDAHVGKIGRGPLFLLFDQPVPRRIAARIVVTDTTGRRLRVRIRRPTSADPVWGGPAPLENLVTVTLVDRPVPGTTVTLSLPTPAGSGLESEVLNLTVAPPLVATVEEAPDPKRSPLASRWLLRFTNPVRGDKVREALVLEPKAPFDVSVWGGEAAAVQATLQPGVRYRMSLRPGFADMLGNRLARPFDVRFRAQDLPPSLELPQEPLLLERSSARLPVRVRNLRRLDTRIFFLETGAFVSALSAPAPPSCEALGGRIGRPRTGPAQAPPLNALVTQEIPLRTTTRRAFVCAEVTAEGRGSEAGADLRGAVLAQVSGLGVTTKVSAGGVLVWVTQLADATPAGEATITLLDARGRSLGTARTAEDGVAVLKVGDLPPSFFVVAETADDTAVGEVSESRLSQAWQFGIAGVAPGGLPLAATVFTDRGAYRPDETVHVKAIVHDAGTAPVRVVVQDPRGQQVLDRLLELDAFAAASLDVKLPPQAPVGEYSLRVEQGGLVASRRFRVEEYRVPTFEVAVKTDEAEWKRGADVHAAVEARYLHGGTLGNREVRWQVVREREAFAPAAFPRFVFSAGDAGSAAGPVAGDEGKLDGAGRLAFSFKADHAPGAGPMRYTVEASVTDVDRQAYAGRISRVVHAAGFYVGVLPPARGVLAVGDTLEVPIAVVRPHGMPEAGVAVRARLERLDYHTTARWSTGGVQLVSRPVTGDTGACTVTSEPAPVTCRFTLAQAGPFRVVAEAEDGAGQPVAGGFEITVSGDTPAAWPRFDRERIEVVADRAGYRPGETATLVVKTPFRAARGLLTVERSSVLEHRLFAIEGDTPRIEVPIGDGDAPNVFASVVLLRGRVHFEKDASGFETGAPAFKMGYASLRVEPVVHALGVDVRAERVAAPGGRLVIDLSVRDAAGSPRGGQATLAVVDEAVLGLTRQRTPDPVAELYAPEPLGVRTAESRLDLPHSRRARHEQVFPGGDGGDGFDLGHSPADLRRLFQSTAYWNPDVRIDADGRARVSVDLPDNVTTYRIMTVVTDGNGRAGSGDRKVLVRKPLMVQPVLPRFAYPDDRMTVEALVFNGTEHEGTVRLRASFEGLSLEGGVAAEQTSEVKAGGSASLRFPVRVTSRGQATVRYQATLDSVADSVEVKLPVLNPGSMRTIVSTPDDAQDGDVSIELPADRQPGTARLEALVSSTSLTALKGAVDYLMGYPNGCIEQTTSTAYPLVVLPDLLPEMGVTVNPDDLKKFSEAGVKRILSFQTTAGGLAYWPGSDEPHAFATAFGLTALLEAKKRGYEVPDASLARMADYLEGALKRGDVTEQIPHGSMPDGDTRAFFVMTLGRLGRPQPAYVNALWHERAKLTPFGLSFLAVAVAESKGDRSLLPPILTEIRAASRFTADEAWFEGRPAGGWSMGSPLRTHAAALLAHAQGARDSDSGGKLLNGLLRRQQGGMWGNTQENVFGIMGVVAQATGAGAAGEAPQFELMVDGRRIRPEQMERVSAHVLRLTLGDDELGLRSGEAQRRRVQVVRRGGPPLFLTVRATYEATLDEANRAPRAAGFEIARHYESLAGEPLDDKPVPLGSVVRVRLRVSAREKQNYVAIADRLPAGLEPMNAALATTETASLGPVSAEAARSLQALSYSEVRDSRVAFFVDDMAAGRYEYVYLARATTPGTFRRPAGAVEAMYRPEIAGSTAIDEVTVQ